MILLSTDNLHAAVETTDYQPFETRDQNFFNLIHGQALPTNAAVLKKSTSLWSSSLVITNTLNTQSNADESIYLDYEAYRFNLSYQYGIDNNWNIKVDLPIIHQSAGVFDSAIDRWHDFFGLPRGARPITEQNQYTVNYTAQDQPAIDLNSASTSLGDLQLTAARTLIENSSTTMSLWASVKLPTGDKAKLTGNGATDISAWLALNHKIAENWLFNMNAGSVLPGAESYQNMPLSNHVFYGHIMLGWVLSDNINLKLQLQGHTSYYDDSRLKILGSTYFLAFGGNIKINSCQRLDIAMNEDVKVDASPDASLLISWHYQDSGC